MPRNAPEGVFSTPAANKPRLLDYVRERLRYLHYSLRTERAYAGWIKRRVGIICNGVVQMKTRDPFESEILGAYEKGELKSIGLSKTELKTFRDAARATLIKNQRVNIRLSSLDLMDIQMRALEEGVPYQTLIASVLHKFVTGRFIEKPSRLTSRSTGRAIKRRAG